MSDLSGSVREGLYLVLRSHDTKPYIAKPLPVFNVVLEPSLGVSS